LARHRFPFLTDAANDVREAVARARARRRSLGPAGPIEARSAAELKRRLDETRDRLKRESAPRADD